MRRTAMPFREKKKRIGGGGGGGGYEQLELFVLLL